ncbi:Kinesin heavy [Hortaea werneckii]|nr:Kinesin heavy [Hortaea werneckii]KAI7377355.1 Kinesin heavy [Hortaea werneckii]
MDSLREANGELTTELDDVKHQLLDAKMSAKESSAQLDEKERLKRERMAEMMAGFDLGDGMMSKGEMHVREMMQQVDSLLEIAGRGEAVAGGELHALKERLLETQSIVRQAELNQGADGHANAADTAMLEAKLSQAQRDYQDVLERNLSEEDVENVKRSLYDSLAQHQEKQPDGSDLGSALARQQEENAKLRSELEALRRNANGNGSNTAASATGLSKQLTDFDTIKKSLMRDLQNRCERVVELEISLDSTREQYNSILRSSNSKQQQKKLAFLERNLEQLTLVQRQLVEQNAQLKKEVAIAERKLVARGERIRGLEGLVAESQEKLMVANHKFESQLIAVRERLEAAKSGSTRGLAGSGGPNANTAGGGGSFIANNPFTRIAKPLRGGGGGGEGFGGLQGHAQQGQAEGGGSSSSGSGGKRASWFFNGQRS